MKPKRRLLLTSVVAACLIAAPAFGDDAPQQSANAGVKAKDPFSIDLESLLNMALSENSTKCPIGAGFRISGLRLRTAVLTTAPVGGEPSAGVLDP